VATSSRVPLIGTGSGESQTPGRIMVCVICHLPS
jgi:hypothetical protein